jgi:6-phosphofructokinase 1
VVGLRDNHILDEDIDEALSKELVFKQELYDEFKIMTENF